MSDPSKRIVQEDISSSCSAPLLERLLRGFMPEGYPDSVTSDYLEFQIWDSVQALMSYVRGMLCSQAIMTGIGVGVQAGLWPCMPFVLCLSVQFTSRLSLALARACAD